MSKITVDKEGRLIIYADILQQAKIRENDTVDVNITPSGILITPLKRHRGDILLKEMNLYEINNYWIPIELLYYENGCLAKSLDYQVEAWAENKEVALEKINDMIKSP